MKGFRTLAIAGVIFICLFSFIQPSEAKMEKGKEKSAIVLAFFGTTYPSGLKAVVNILQTVKKAFPNTEVRVTFTSNIIRSIWRKRQKEAKLWLSRGVPKEILYVKGILATMDELQERGYKNIVVQSTHIYHIEQVEDLLSYIRALRSIETVKERWRPFHKIAFGRPIFGGVGDKYDYHEDMKKAVFALKEDVELAKKKGAVLVYMGHGNEFWSTGIYIEAQKMFRKLFPDVQVFVGTVEGFPSLDHVLYLLRTHAKSRKIILKPFMVVAGDHAHNDMAGDKPDSWKNVFEKNGFEVTPIFEGLGEKPGIANIVVEHIKDAARDAGIILK